MDGLAVGHLRENLSFLRQDLGLSQLELQTCIKKYPLVVIHSVASMRDNVKFYRRIVCLTDRQVQKLVVAQPGRMRRSIVCVGAPLGACTAPASSLDRFLGARMM